MEWVETTGRTIEDALDAALDELGVDENDVEYEVMARPRGGILGRFGGEARIRARVKPISREKPVSPGGDLGGAASPADETRIEPANAGHARVLGRGRGATGHRRTGGRGRRGTVVAAAAAGAGGAKARV
jgi:spoIIIJ-associated protein